MKVVALIALGLGFPPLLALDSRTWAPFMVLSAVEISLVAIFIFVAWGPAVLGHLVLWLVGIWVILRSKHRVNN